MGQPVQGTSGREYYRRLGERLRDVRVDADITQDEVAEFLELTQPIISKIETGFRRVTVEELARLARFYGVPVETLIVPIA
jgi:transcriptional regulator with XRE-family HTH domain